jgi:hypothetical protein
VNKGDASGSLAAGAEQDRLTQPEPIGRVFTLNRMIMTGA